VNIFVLGQPVVVGLLTWEGVGHLGILQLMLYYYTALNKIYPR
jgi:hypothetical protein